MSLHPALGSISMMRRHSSAPRASELQPVAGRSAAVRLKPLVLTPARSVSTPLTGSSKERRLNAPLSPLGYRSSPASPSSSFVGQDAWSRSSTPNLSRPGAARRRSMGYRSDGGAETPEGPYDIKRSDSVWSDTTASSSDLSRRGSAETCDTDVTTPSSLCEKMPSYLDRSRLPSLQHRFDPQRGLSLDVVMETDDDSSFEAGPDPEDSSSAARYQAFWGNEASRNESAFQDVCVALDELAPSFPNTPMSLRSESSSTYPVRRGGSEAGDERDPLRRQSSKPLIKEGGGPISSADIAAARKAAETKRVSRAPVWPPPNETKRLSLAPVLGYNSDDEQDGPGTSESDMDEKPFVQSRRPSHEPRSARTRPSVDEDSGDFLDFLVQEAPSTTEVRLADAPTSPRAPVSPRTPAPVCQAAAQTPARAPQATPLSPKTAAKSSGGFASKLFKSWTSPSRAQTPQSPKPKAIKKRPASLITRPPASPITSRGSPTRPIISGPLELEGSQSTRSGSSIVSCDSVATISLEQARRRGSTSTNASRPRINTQAVLPLTDAVCEGEGASEELLAFYSDLAMPSPNPSGRASTATPSPSSSPKKLPPPPLFLSPLWPLPLNDLPRSPLAWAERSGPIHRVPSNTSIASAGPTAVLIESYA